MKHVVLPNGIPVWEINSYETKFLYDEIFRQEVYGTYGIEVPAGGVILDIGANIGMFALYAARKFGNPKIYCVEPAPHCLKALEQNVAPLGANVEILRTALGRSNGQTDFFYYPNYSIMSGMFADEARDLEVLKEGARTQFTQADGAPPDDRILDVLVGTKLSGKQQFRCAVTTVSDVIDDHKIERVSLAKIDVERAEGIILDGIREEHWPLIEQFVIEVHDQGHHEHETMRDLLVSKGFDVELFAEPMLKNSSIYVVLAKRSKRK